MCVCEFVSMYNSIIQTVSCTVYIYEKSTMENAKLYDLKRIQCGVATNSNKYVFMKSTYRLQTHALHATQ